MCHELIQPQLYFLFRFVNANDEPPQIAPVAYYDVLL